MTASKQSAGGSSSAPRTDADARRGLNRTSCEAGTAERRYCSDPRPRGGAERAHARRNRRVTVARAERKAAIGAESSSVATRHGRVEGRTARKCGECAPSAAAVCSSGSGWESAMDSAMCADIGNETSLTARLGTVSDLDSKAPAGHPSTAGAPPRSSSRCPAHRRSWETVRARRVQVDNARAGALVRRRVGVCHGRGMTAENRASPDGAEMRRRCRDPSGVAPHRERRGQRRLPPVIGSAHPPNSRSGLRC